MSPESPDSFLKNHRLGGDPVVSGLEAKEFKNQEGPEGQSDMGTLRLGLPALATLHIRDLLQSPVILLDLPTRLGKPQTPQVIHLQIVGGPVLRRTVLGNDPEHFHHPIILQMDYRAGCGDVEFPDRSIASSVRVHPPVVLEPCQPTPPDCINPFQVHQAAVSAIKKHIFRLESALLSRVDQVPEMVVLRLAVIRLVIDPVITRQVAFAIGPKQRQ